MTRRFYLDQAHGQVHGRIAKTEGKPWIVLLHQSPSSSAMFDALIPFLADDFSIIAPDNPGFGNSDPLPRASVQAFGESIGEVLAHFDIRQAYIFGHHTGAAIGAYLGAQRPDLCAAIAMCGPPALDAEQRQILPAMAPVAVPVASGQHLLDIWAKLRAKETDAPPALSTREVGLAFWAVSTAQTYQAVADYDFMEALSQINCPLLLFSGERDSLAGYLPAASTAAPRAKIVKLEDAGGYVCDMRPDLVARLLIDFFLRGDHGS